MKNSSIENIKFTFLDKLFKRKERLNKLINNLNNERDTLIYIELLEFNKTDVISKLIVLNKEGGEAKLYKYSRRGYKLSMSYGDYNPLLSHIYCKENLKTGRFILLKTRQLGQGIPHYDFYTYKNVQEVLNNLG